MTGMPDVIIRVMRDLHEKSQFTSNRNPSVYGDAADLIESLRARVAYLEERVDSWTRDAQNLQRQFAAAEKARGALATAFTSLHHELAALKDPPC